MPTPRRIDFHFHLIPPFYRDAVYAAGKGPAIGRYPDWSPEQALALMDTNGIEVAITSLAQPGVQFADLSEAATLAHRCNEYAADLAARWPKRFGAFATIPVGEEAASISAIVHSLDALKLNGVCLFASYGEKFLGDPSFDPMLEVLNDRSAVVFIHPALHPSSRGLDLQWPGFMMEYLFDTTRAVVNLVFGGALDRFPRIRFVIAHAGGLVPYFAWRLSVSPMIDSRLPQIPRYEVYARLRHLWYDNALSPAQATFECLRDVASASRLVFGSDWPFANANVIAEAVKTYESVESISQAQRIAIDRGNALSLFPQFT
jgi:predicted TIM-barrel fold metal-dependent hydrolase